jgi:hypothetical protein
MSPKSTMLVVCLSTWMYAAISCAALPILHALPTLKSIGSFVPLFAALVAGALIGVPMSITVHRLCGLSSSKSEKNVWGDLTTREAAIFGIVCWGVPVGLMFVVHEFLQSSDPFVAVSGFIIWPASGVAFGLIMRWLARRRSGSQVA